MPPPLPVVHELIAALGNDTFEQLCQLHFPAVHRTFTSRQTLPQRIGLLLERVDLHDEYDALLTAVRGLAPDIYARFEARLSSQPTPTPPVQPTDPTCDVLVLAANPNTTPELDLRTEADWIRQRLQEGDAGRRLRVHHEWAVRSDDLPRLLLRHRPFLLHFSGHGNSAGDILLHDAHDNPRPVPPEAFADLLRSADDRLECVVLNACFTADLADALADRVRCVVGMVRAFDDESASRFSAGFYRGLAFGKDYATAFELGRSEVAVLELPDPEVPHFFSRDTAILDPDNAVPGPVRRVTRTHETPLPLTSPHDPRSYPLWFGTHRRPADPHDLSKGFTAERSDRIHHGTCRVTVPRSHRIGEVQSPWYLRWLRSSTDRLRLDPASLRGLDPDAFRTDLAHNLAPLAADERTALVYLHGYNMSFEDAALRAAQLGFDLQVPGLTAFYSWPSQGRFRGYFQDEAAIDASSAFLTEFLTDFVRHSGATRIDLIAHSMGNRALLRCLGEVVKKTGLTVPFGQVFLAAPDVDRDEFRQSAGVYGQVAVRTTLYVSSRDRALAASARLHGWHRAGYLPPVTVVPGLDTVEASGVDLSWLGHGYYAAARPILTDLHTLLRHNDPPAKRMGLRSVRTPEGQPYWVVGA
jgi:esterase/lipase superfamily enzyme